MKPLYAIVLSLLIILACSLSSYGVQGAGGETITPGAATPKKPTVPPKTRPRGKGHGTPASTPAPAPSPLADLIVSTSLSGCAILIDGEYRGATNHTGILRLAALKPGEHILTLRKDGYREAQQTINLFAGRSESLEVRLKLLPPKRSVPELLEKANADYHSDHFAEVIESTVEILKSQPDHAKANLLLGQSYFALGNRDQANAYLLKAYALGEPISLPIKHHHLSKLGILNGKANELCMGVLVFRKGGFEFHSKDKAEEDFTITVDKIIEIKNEAYKEGRLSVRVKIPKGKKEAEVTYNFHVHFAEVRRNAAGVAMLACDNPNCVPLVDTLQKLLQQIKQ
ncbi:MAG: PEGA domain-containing protein [Acidobacteria bacterium]|nr:PEGA domain-containing protein [Acidobacteriota bacterium]